MGSIKSVTGAVPPKAISAINNADPMKITKVEVVRFRPDLKTDGHGVPWMWVRLNTNNGIVGVGETYPYTEGQVGMLKDLEERNWMGNISGRDPRDIEGRWREVFAQIAFHGWGGSDMRILTAINIAQWDILGKALGVPIYRLLGGKAQHKFSVYNTYTSYWTINRCNGDRHRENCLVALGVRGTSQI
jgi:galactonate dehydratase